MISVTKLYALQEVDLALDAERATLTDVKSRMGQSDAVGEARTVLEQREAELHDAEREFKNREADADALREKISPVERRLYEGSGKNPKELEDLQKDLDHLKARRSGLEDSALESMEALEHAQAAQEEARRRLSEVEAEDREEQEELRVRQAALEKAIIDLEGRRAERSTDVDGEIMGLYDRLRTSRQGRAVVKAEGGTCQGCRISLPMNLLQRSRTGHEVVQCTSCERILYVS